MAMESGVAKVRKVEHPYPFEVYQTRIDESIVTGKPLVERPYWYANMETGQLYYDLYGCVGWPSEVSDRDNGLPGYAAIVGVVKSASGERPAEDAPFQLLAEIESLDVPDLLDEMVIMRAAYGFGETPALLSGWLGDPERYITAIALRNERLMVTGGSEAALLVYPPDDFYQRDGYDIYVRALRSALTPGRVRFFFGGNEILKNKLREFRRNDPAVYAVGGLVHSLLGRTMWMDQARENVFTIEVEEVA